MNTELSTQRKNALLAQLDRSRYSLALAESVLGLSGIVRNGAKTNKAATKRSFFSYMNKKYPIMSGASVLKAIDVAGSYSHHNRSSDVRESRQSYVCRQTVF